MTRPTTPAVRVDAKSARSVAGRIRQGIRDYLATLALVKRAWDEQHWQVLGYDSWQDYVDGEFGAERLGLPAEHREKALSDLRMAGMSVRAISAVTGVPKSTVADGLAQLSGVGQLAGPETVRGLDGRTRPARVEPPVAAGEADAQLDAPGVDSQVREAPAGAPTPAGAGETATGGYGPPAPVDGTATDSGDLRRSGVFPADGESVPAPDPASGGLVGSGVTPDFAPVLFELKNLADELPPAVRARVRSALGALTREIREALDEMGADR